jgi:transposase-like protein
LTHGANRAQALVLADKEAKMATAVVEMPIMADVVQCPICSEYMHGAIYQCGAGHVLCHNCRHRLTQCPVCRAPLTDIRNRVLEHMAESIRAGAVIRLPDTPSSMSSAASALTPTVAGSGRESGSHSRNSSLPSFTFALPNAGDGSDGHSRTPSVSTTTAPLAASSATTSRRPAGHHRRNSSIGGLVNGRRIKAPSKETLARLAGATVIVPGKKQSRRGKTKMNIHGHAHSTNTDIDNLTTDDDHPNDHTDTKRSRRRPKDAYTTCHLNRTCM